MKQHGHQVGQLWCGEYGSTRNVTQGKPSHLTHPEGKFFGLIPANTVAGFWISTAKVEAVEESMLKLQPTAHRPVWAFGASERERMPVAVMPEPALYPRIANY
jgi:hypothetical protein